MIWSLLGTLKIKGEIIKGQSRVVFILGTLLTDGIILKTKKIIKNFLNRANHS